MLSIDTQGGYGTGLCSGALLVAYGPEDHALLIGLVVGVAFITVAVARVLRGSSEKR